MNPGPIPPDRPLRAKLRELGLLSREQEAGLPQFLLLATECDGARQIARFLQCHPGCALPDALETRFFSSRHQRHDLDWYVRALGDDPHLVRGEWSPSYILVPVKTIRLIQELLPQLKLVFLLRDPAVEAWHAWRESQPSDQTAGTVSETWPWALADLLGQLRRWKSVFPADQFFIGFEEQIHSEQGTFLKGLCEFLGIEPVPPERRENLRTDLPAQPPALEVSLLREVCRTRIEELATCLHDEFGQNVPAHWTAAPALKFDSQQVAQLTRLFSTAVKHEFDDVYLFRAVQSHEETSRCLLSSAIDATRPPRNADSRTFMFNPDQVAVHGDEPPLLVREGYHGYNVVAFRQEFIIIPQAAGQIDLPRMSGAALDAKVHAGEFLRARSLADSVRVIDEFRRPSETEFQPLSPAGGLRRCLES